MFETDNGGDFVHLHLIQPPMLDEIWQLEGKANLLDQAFAQLRPKEPLAGDLFRVEPGPIGTANHQFVG